MTMKKIKPQYGKVFPPFVKSEEDTKVSEIELSSVVSLGEERAEEKRPIKKNKSAGTQEKETEPGNDESSSPAFARATPEPNPFLQTKEVFGKARLTKIGYRMRTDYVEILDIIKKLKKNGYTLEAVLDDALTFYFENSEDGREALKKAEIFYS